MPSILLGTPALSGGMILVSGFPWSGKAMDPVGGIQLRLHPNASGNVYVALSGGPNLSGGITLNSGGLFMSGGGLNDGMILAPGDAYFIPRIATGLSGNLTIYIRHDAACSGQARLYYEKLAWLAPVGTAALMSLGGLLNYV